MSDANCPEVFPFEVNRYKKYFQAKGKYHEEKTGVVDQAEQGRNNKNNHISVSLDIIKCIQVL